MDQNTNQQNLQIEKDDLVVLETHAQEIIIARIVDISNESFSVQKLADNSLASIPRSSVARVRTANVPSDFKETSSQVAVQPVLGSADNPFVIG